MFNAVGSGPLQAMLWLAIILCCGFTAFTLFGIVPLIRVVKEQSDLLRSILQHMQDNADKNS